MEVSKVTSKFQATVPADVRAALGIKAGDRLAWEVRDGIATVRVLPGDLKGWDVLSWLSLSEEWMSPEDEDAFVDFDPFDVVTLLFPFADRDAAVARPAVVLAVQGRHGTPDGVALVAMITTGGRSPWPTDTTISDLPSAGLLRPCVVRLKLNTVDSRLVARRIGRLGDSDRQAVRTALLGLMGGVLES